MKSKIISGKDVAGLIGKDEAIIIDLREKDRYRKGHIPTAFLCLDNDSEIIGNNIIKIKNQSVFHFDDIKYIKGIINIVNNRTVSTSRVNENELEILLYCEHGGNSYRIAEQLASVYDVKVMSLYGGIAGYKGKVIDD